MDVPGAAELPERIKEASPLVSRFLQREHVLVALRMLLYLVHTVVLPLHAEDPSV